MLRAMLQIQIINCYLPAWKSNPIIEKSCSMLYLLQLTKSIFTFIAIVLSIAPTLDEEIGDVHLAVSSQEI